jgi:hypothetical protein
MILENCYRREEYTNTIIKNNNKYFKIKSKENNY